MSNQRVASRYAKSLLELAIEQGQLEEVFADFKALEAMGKGSRELTLLLSNPVVNSEKKLKVLMALFAKGSAKLTTTFFEIVSRKNREGILMDIAREFVFQYNIHKSIQVAELTTAVAIDESQKAQFISLVKEITGMKEAQLVQKINPDLIGGFVLKVNDRQLDESLSSKLNVLRMQLTKNHYEKQF
jgi:F-type H+-transporting ATPase subunit delta